MGFQPVAHVSVAVQLSRQPDKAKSAATQLRPGWSQTHRIAHAGRCLGNMLLSREGLMPQTRHDNQLNSEYVLYYSRAAYLTGPLVAPQQKQTRVRLQRSAMTLKRRVLWMRSILEDL